MRADNPVPTNVNITKMLQKSSPYGENENEILKALKDVLKLKEQVTPEEWQEFIDFWKVRFTDEDTT